MHTFKLFTVGWSVAAPQEKPLKRFVAQVEGLLMDRDVIGRLVTAEDLV
jgi:hypothetical protein